MGTWSDFDAARSIHVAGNGGGEQAETLARTLALHEQELRIRGSTATKNGWIGGFVNEFNYGVFDGSSVTDSLHPTSTTIRKGARGIQHGLFATFSCLIALLTMQTLQSMGGVADGVATATTGGMACISALAGPGEALCARLSQVARIYRQLLPSQELDAQAFHCVVAGRGKSRQAILALLNHPHGPLILALRLTIGPVRWHCASHQTIHTLSTARPASGQGRTNSQCFTASWRATWPLNRAAIYMRNHNQLAPPTHG